MMDLFDELDAYQTEQEIIKHSHSAAMYYLNGDYDKMRQELNLVEHIKNCNKYKRR